MGCEAANRANDESCGGLRVGRLRTVDAGGGIRQWNTIWQCEGLKWQPVAREWVMGNEAVAIARPKTEIQSWTDD